MSEPTQVLNYASPPSWRPSKLSALARLTLTTSILSGLSVLSCWLGASGSNRALPIFVVVNGLLIFFAVWAGIESTRIGRRSQWRIMEIVSLVGLVMLVISAFMPVENIGNVLPRVARVPVAVAFSLLACSAWRSVPLYRELAAMVLSTNPRLAGAFHSLGWGKAIYETAWLTCCVISVTCNEQYYGIFYWMPAIFLAALGYVGYLFIWIWMILVHISFLSTVKRALT